VKDSLTAVPPSAQPAGAEVAPFHRSGAVARMLRMPVATLRVWERRYALTEPALSAGGQRLYSAADVRRLSLIKQLIDLGHAIGSLAALDMPQLQRVAWMRANTWVATQPGEREAVAAAPSTPALPLRPWRLALIGRALGSRMRRPALLRQLALPVALLGPYDDAAQAATALRGTDVDVAVDALLFFEPQLHEAWLAAFAAAAPALAGLPKAVLYGFAAEPVCEALAAAGTVLLREPQPDAVVAQWLRSLFLATAARLPVGEPRTALGPLAMVPMLDRAHEPVHEFVQWPVPPRRWGDAALADFAGRSSTIACECPRHVAELLMQLSHFEAYSAECESRSPADAQLHAHLRQVAATSRARFESALEQVALHEGMMLPL
jgi:MerR family transcriptional regulator, light-induced transcriptional regulator